MVLFFVVPGDCPVLRWKSAYWEVALGFCTSCGCSSAVLPAGAAPVALSFCHSLSHSHVVLANGFIGIIEAVMDR